MVNLLSTTHDRPDDDNSVKLPEMVNFCNKNKGGVDVFNRMCKNYTVTRKSRKWPLSLCYGLLNMVGIDSHILLKQSIKTK